MLRGQFFFSGPPAWTNQPGTGPGFCFPNPLATTQPTFNLKFYFSLKIITWKSKDIMIPDHGVFLEAYDTYWAFANSIQINPMINSRGTGGQWRKGNGVVVNFRER